MALDRLRHLRVKPVESTKAHIQNWKDKRAKKLEEELQADIEKLEKEAEKERTKTQLLEKKHDKQIELTSLRKRQEFARKETKKKRSKIDEAQLVINEIRKFQQSQPMPQPQSRQVQPRYNSPQQNGTIWDMLNNTPMPNMLNINTPNMTNPRQTKPIRQSYPVVDMLDISNMTKPRQTKPIRQSYPVVDMLDINRW